MNNLTPQQKEAMIYDRHISVTANAGSGKTFVLSKRFVEIALNSETDLSSIVAITFTDKAAGELEKKIAREIEEKLYESADVKTKNKLENLRRQLVSANISTIHSFCINILKEFAPEAEIDANFIPIDKSTSDELIELSVEETVNSLIQNPSFSSELQYLIRFFSSKKLLSAQLISAIEKRNTIERYFKEDYEGSDSNLAEEMTAKFENLFNSIFSQTLTDLIPLLKKINEFVLSKNADNKYALEAGYILNSLPAVQPQFQTLSLLKELDKNLLTKELSVRKSGYLNKEREKFTDEIGIIENSFNNLSNFFNADKSGLAHLELVRFVKIFLKIYEYALSIYTSKKRKNGFMDFEDLLISTQKILDLENVRSVLREKYKYIMIDEYQDTNELQYEIIMPILNHLKSGNIFVVGDEKQSIYLFRNADLEIFERTKNEIQSSVPEGEIINLPHSFRTAPSLISFINHLFENLFRNPDKYFNEVDHNDLICTKDEMEGKVEFLLADSAAGVRENDLVARKIIVLMKNKSELNFSNIAVLCRKRDSFLELEESFVRYGVPFTILGGKGFYQRQTIYDVYNYLAFLLNREDDAALVGILRSPFFNFSDRLLFKLKNQSGKTFFEKLKNYADTDEEVKQAVLKLGENYNTALGMEISSLIRKLLRESGYWTVIAAKRNSTQELANIQKLLSLARSYSQKSFKNLYDFTLFLRESIEGFEDEGQAQIACDENSVKILTVHQAKGLEYKAVFLYGCNEFGQDDSVKARSLSIDKNFGILSKVPLNQKYFEKQSTPPIVSLYNYINERKNRAELKRLLYVGITRAINYLFISGTHKDFKLRNNSFFQILSEGLKTDFRTKNIFITKKVQFMRIADGKHEFFSKEVPAEITFIDQIEEPEINSADPKIVENEKTDLTEIISDLPEREIISATKISMFTQCPVKYQLTYELGYSAVHNLVKKEKSNYEFNANEDVELMPYAQFRGKLIHAILKDEIRETELEQYISGLVALEIPSEKVNDRVKLLESIINEIRFYYSSAQHKEISGYINYKNEYEVYCSEGKNYLYGIIDRLVIENEKLIIIDFKTDNVKEEQINARAADYMPQLKFYAYVLSKLFADFKKYELRLVFLKHPDSPVKHYLDAAGLSSYQSELGLAIDSINSGNYKQNLTHCSKCHFSMEGNKCVKNIFSE